MEQQQQQLYQTTTTCILLTKQLISLSFDKITAIIQNNENEQQGKIIQKLQGNALLDCIKSFKMEEAEKLVQKSQDKIMLEDIAIFFPNFNLEQFEQSNADFELTDQETRVLYVQNKLEEMLNQPVPQKQTLMGFIFSSKLNISIIVIIFLLLIAIIILILKLKMQNSKLLNLANNVGKKQDKQEKQQDKTAQKSAEAKKKD